MRQKSELIDCLRVSSEEKNVGFTCRHVRLRAGWYFMHEKECCHLFPARFQWHPKIVDKDIPQTQKGLKKRGEESSFFQSTNKKANIHSVRGGENVEHLTNVERGKIVSFEQTCWHEFSGKNVMKLVSRQGSPRTLTFSRHFLRRLSISWNRSACFAGFSRKSMFGQ